MSYFLLRTVSKVRFSTPTRAEQGVTVTGLLCRTTPPIFLIME